MFNTSLFKVAALLTLGLTTLAVLPSAAPAPQGPFNHLVGVWEIDGTPDASSGIDPFVNLVTISADGRVINVDPNLGAGVGESYRLAPQNFAVGFFGYLDASGTRYEVQGTVTRTGFDQFDGPFRTIVTDANGNTLFTYEGTVHGQRLSAQAY